MITFNIKLKNDVNYTQTLTRLEPKLEPELAKTRIGPNPNWLEPEWIRTRINANLKKFKPEMICPELVQSPPLISNIKSFKKWKIKNEKKWEKISFSQGFCFD